LRVKKGKARPESLARCGPAGPRVNQPLRAYLKECVFVKREIFENAFE